MIIEPFKVPIYTKELILDNKALASYCLNNRKSNKGRVLSNDGGWQSENLYTYLQGEKYPQPISELCNDILTIAIEFARTIDMIDKLEIDNIWANINGYKDYNLPHKHPNCLLSGVYYVKVPKNSGEINFVNPASGTMQYDWNKYTIKEYNNHNSANYTFRAKVGTLYMFPGWLNHFVKQNLNKTEERISFSFNVKVQSGALL